MTAKLFDFYYPQGEPRAHWHHGKLTKSEAEEVLRSSDDTNCFLIRKEHGEELILSLLYEGQVYHMSIEYNPGQGFSLQGSNETNFYTLSELVMNYYTCGIGENPRMTLGNACKKVNLTWQH